jgi:hypothetical protein
MQTLSTSWAMWRLRQPATIERLNLHQLQRNGRGQTSHALGAEARGPDRRRAEESTFGALCDTGCVGGAEGHAPGDEALPPTDEGEISTIDVYFAGGGVEVSGSHTRR